MCPDKKGFTAEALSEQLRGPSKGIIRLKRFAILFGCLLWWAGAAYSSFYFIFKDIPNLTSIETILYSAGMGFLLAVPSAVFVYQMVMALVDIGPRIKAYVTGKKIEDDPIH